MLRNISLRDVILCNVYTCYLRIPYASATLKTPKIHIRACICIYKKSHNLICNMGP